MEVCMFCLFGASVGGTLYPEINTGHFTGNSIPTTRTLCKCTRLLPENHESKQRVYSDKFIVYTVYPHRSSNVSENHNEPLTPSLQKAGGMALSGIPQRVSTENIDL